MSVDNTPVVGWLVKGFTGVMRMLEEMDSEGVYFDDGWILLLSEYVNRGQAIINSQVRKRESCRETLSTHPSVEEVNARLHPPGS